jgi:hypothetical protein
VGTVLAAAAAVMIFVRAGGPITRPKGGPGVAFYIRHGADVRPGAPGERVQPGDFLQLVYTSAAPLYGAILSVDGAHHVSRYFPDDARAAPLPAGTAQSFPRSTQLDEVLGHETVYALLCREPMALAPLEDTLAADRPLDAPGCQVERFELEKIR